MENAKLLLSDDRTNIIYIYFNGLLSKDQHQKRYDVGKYKNPFNDALLSYGGGGGGGA